MYIVELIRNNNTLVAKAMQMRIRDIQQGKIKDRAKTWWDRPAKKEG